ncbi:MAG: ATP-grasp fold amidoligase family protein [Candidatus Omnitrophota bacterium]
MVSRIIRRFIEPLRFLLGKAAYARLEFFHEMGYWPSLSSPKSFSEKVLRRKLKNDHSLASSVVDKWAVRDYVLSRTHKPEILNEVFYRGRVSKDIPFDDLPSRFVIKLTHGSGWNFIVKDKGLIQRQEIIDKCNYWLGLKYSVSSRNYLETHYDRVLPQVIVESFLEDSQYGIPLDYKFFCFHGKAYCIQVDIGRFVDHKRNFYDINWNQLPFALKHPRGMNIPRPKKLTEMINIAEQLAVEFDFCRVDLYSPDDKAVIFGEITLIPGSGYEKFNPREWDYILGGKWSLPA